MVRKERSPSILDELGMLHESISILSETSEALTLKLAPILGSQGNKVEEVLPLSESEESEVFANISSARHRVLRLNNVYKELIKLIQL